MEVKANAERRMEIILQEDSDTLEEVVVVGYGTMKKADLTGSVATVGSEVIEMQKNIFVPVLKLPKKLSTVVISTSIQQVISRTTTMLCSINRIIRIIKKRSFLLPMLQISV